jgi:TRAP transporter TAXI family solute receptor
MKRFGLSACVWAIVFIMALTGCQSSSTAPQQKSDSATKYMTIGTATVGGAWYSMGGAMANIISKYIPGIKANAAPTGASIENLESIKNGKMEIGFATTDVPYSMYRGINGFAENKTFKSLVNNDLIYLAVIVKANSPIKKFTDIKGKKLGTGVPGSSNYIIVEEVLKAHGMTYNDVKPFPAGVSQQATALKDGNVDMFAYVVAGTGGAAPAIVELTTTENVRFIPLEKSVLEKINKAKPYYLIRDIPVGWAKGIDKPVAALAVGTTICVKADLPEDMVYQIVKTMFDHKGELDSIHPQWKMTTKETAAIELPVPLHPGAEKYYKEIGAPIAYLK